MSLFRCVSLEVTKDIINYNLSKGSIANTFESKDKQAMVFPLCVERRRTINILVMTVSSK